MQSLVAVRSRSRQRMGILINILSLVIDIRGKCRWWSEDTQELLGHSLKEADILDYVQFVDYEVHFRME